MSLMNLKEGASELRISSCTARRMIKDGKLPCRRVGGKIFFLPEDLQNFLQKCLVTSNPRKEAVS